MAATWFCEAANRYAGEIYNSGNDCDGAKLLAAVKAISGLCDRLMPTWDGAIGRIKDIAEAALSATPRNCDVYSADELKAIFKMELASELPIANEHEKNLITITAMRTIDTLFATTKEGGNDGNK